MGGGGHEQPMFILEPYNVLFYLIEDHAGKVLKEGEVTHQLKKVSKKKATRGCRGPPSIKVQYMQ